MAADVEIADAIHLYNSEYIENPGPMIWTYSRICILIQGRGAKNITCKLGDTSFTCFIRGLVDIHGCKRQDKIKTGTNEYTSMCRHRS